MTRIGKYRVVGTQRLFIPKNEESWIQFPDGKDSIDVKISFEDDSNEKSSSLRAEGKGAHLHLTLKNWKSPLGQCTASPIQIGKTDAGEPIHLMAASWMIGDMRIIEIQVLAGGDQ
jgi:hypothetical protein